MKLRARKDDDKLLRRQAILLAADRLLTIGNNDLPSSESIAHSAALAKGSLYRYFQTKEEIYFVLLGERMEGWLKHIAEIISDPKNANEPRRMVRAIARYCVDNPKTLHLTALSPVLLENNVPESAAYEFKRGLAASVATMASLLTVAIPLLSRAAAITLLLNSHALIIGLWQTANPPPMIASLFKRSELAILRVSITDDLPRALESLWMGAIYG